MGILSCFIQIAKHTRIKLFWFWGCIIIIIIFFLLSQKFLKETKSLYNYNSNNVCTFLAKSAPLFKICSLSCYRITIFSYHNTQSSLVFSPTTVTVVFAPSATLCPNSFTLFPRLGSVTVCPTLEATVFAPVATLFPRLFTSSLMNPGSLILSVALTRT